MRLEELQRGQASTVWRDRATQAVWLAFHLGSREAVGRVGRDAPDADLLDTYWDPAAFANHRVDTAMKEALAGPLRAVLGDAETVVRTLRVPCGSLLDDLSGEIEAVIRPATKALPAGKSTGNVDWGARFEFNSTWPNRALHVGAAGAAAAAVAPEMLVGVLGYGAVTLAKPLFAYRIASSAQARVSKFWIGDGDCSGSAMGKILASVDRLASGIRGGAQ